MESTGEGKLVWRVLERVSWCGEGKSVWRVLERVSWCGEYWRG